MTDLRNFEKIGGGSGPRSRRRLTAKALLCTSVVAFASAALPSLAAASAYPTLAPLVTGTSATPTSSGATLNSTVYPYGSETYYHFEYGPNSSYGTSIPITEVDLGSAEYPASTQVHQTITGLSPGMTYHYRIAAHNGIGAATGATGDRPLRRSLTRPPRQSPSMKQVRSQVGSNSAARSTQTELKRTTNSNTASRPNTGPAVPKASSRPGRAPRSLHRTQITPAEHHLPFPARRGKLCRLDPQRRQRFTTPKIEPAHPSPKRSNRLKLPPDTNCKGTSIRTASKPAITSNSGPRPAMGPTFPNPTSISAKENPPFPSLRKSS